jgi:hypothetical protein
VRALAAAPAWILTLTMTAGLASGCAADRAARAGAPTEADPALGAEQERLYREAESLYHAGRTGEARERLSALASRADLPPGERLRALTQRGVIELEEGDGPAAERTLEAALAGAEPGPPVGAAAAREAGGAEAGEERYYRGKARFHLGEVYRRRFRAVELDPAASPPQELAARLDEKASLLLAARERYLRAVGVGEPTWAVAAGARVGELYEQLRREMLEAPLPPGLDADAAAAYHAELRERARVLVAGALEAYEDTLGLARRTGTDGPFAVSAEEGLARMNRALAETGPGTGPPTSPP